VRRRRGPRRTSFSSTSGCLNEAGIDKIISNKNHYTRWEHRLDYLRWCEEVGILSDQTRGPSKHGTIGFPLGGSQPYFPLDDERETPRRLNVLEVNLMTQDLVQVCPRRIRQAALRLGRAHHGVAHFLFHPAHIVKPPVAEALLGLVDYGRSQGIEWWKNDEIYQWEAHAPRRESQLRLNTTFTLNAAINRFARQRLLLLKPGQESRPITVNGKSVQGDTQTVYGFEFDAVAVDVEGELKVRIG
jgi:hypothetical protein